MSESVVIVGSGPSGLRAAAWWRARGAAVTYLAGDDVRHAASRGELCGVDAPASASGILAVTRGVVRRAVFAAGKVRAVPLTATDSAALLPPTTLGGAARGWVQARTRGELKKLVGGGNETRTYRDWVVQGLGGPVYQHVFAPYARKRFGDPEALSANVARYLHGRVEGETSGEQWVARDVGALDGVRVVDARSGIAQVDRDVVTTRDGERFEGRVFVDLAPMRMVGLLPEEVRESMRSDAVALQTRDLARVRLTAQGPLPAVTDVLDAGVPFFRVVREADLPGAEGAPPDALTAVLLGGEGLPDHAVVASVVEGLARMGVSAERGGAQVERILDGQPVWVGPHLARARRHVEALVARGVTPFGRAGLHAPLDPCEEIAYLDAVAGGVPVREAVRAWVEPAASAVESRPRIIVPVVR